MKPTNNRKALSKKAILDAIKYSCDPFFLEAVSIQAEARKMQLGPNFLSYAMEPVFL